MPGRPPYSNNSRPTVLAVGADGDCLDGFFLSHITLKYLSIGTPKAINFPFVSNEKLMFFKVSQYSSTLQ